MNFKYKLKSNKGDLTSKNTQATGVNLNVQNFKDDESSKMSFT